MNDGTDFRDKDGGGQFSACAELNNPHPIRNQGSYALEKEQKTPSRDTCNADDTHRLAITMYYVLPFKEFLGSFLDGSKDVRTISLVILWISLIS